MRSRRLKPLAGIAQQFADEAALSWQESSRKLAAAEARLGQLQAYRQEYLDSYSQFRKGSVHAGFLQEFHFFLEGLNKAITQAEITVAAVQEEHTLARQAWITSRAKAQAIARLMEQAQVQEQKALETMEQNRLDEHVQWSFLKHRAER
jgi:flagellar FliJ protein